MGSVINNDRAAVGEYERATLTHGFQPVSTSGLNPVSTKGSTGRSVAECAIKLRVAYPIPVGAVVIDDPLLRVMG